MSSLKIDPSKAKTKYPHFCKSQDVEETNGTTAADSFIRNIANALGASKPLEIEYIRSLHRQICLYELENKYLHKELKKNNFSSSNVSEDEEFAVKEPDFKNISLEMANDQRNVLVNELVRKSDELQEKLIREISLRKEQLDILAQDILRLKNEKEEVEKKNQEKDKAIENLNKSLIDWEDRLTETQEQFETCKLALTAEVKRRKFLESKVKEQMIVLVGHERTMQSAGKKVQIESVSKNMIPKVENTQLYFDSERDLCRSIDKLSKLISNQTEELKELKSAINKFERLGVTDSTSLPTQTESTLRWFNERKVSENKTNSEIFTTPVRRRWQNMEDSRISKEGNINEALIRPMGRKQ